MVKFEIGDTKKKMCCGDKISCSKRSLHILAFIIWLCGAAAVNAKLVLYTISATKGYTSEYKITCLPDSITNKNRTYIPLSIGLFIGLIQIPFMIRFIRRNYTRIHHLNEGYLCSTSKSCYHSRFLLMLFVVIVSFIVLDIILCGNDNFSENYKGSKCVFIGFDACVGPFLLFGMIGFIVSYMKGPYDLQHFYGVNSTSNLNKHIINDYDADEEKPVAVL